jgi:hypothetical protein
MSDKNTIVTTYGEAMEIMDYMNDFCGCCRSNFYKEWYEANEAYFVRKGVFVLDNLLYVDCIKDDKEILKPVRYCFKFDFSEKSHASFTILNYYNQEKVADFSFHRKDNPEFKKFKIRLDYANMKAFDKLGEFLNQDIAEKVKKTWDRFYKISESLPKSKYQESYNKQMQLEKKMILQFMCEHTIDIIHDCMCYFTKENPKEIPYTSYFSNQEDLEYTTKKETYTYKYTGYINLNDTKVYMTSINSKLNEEKKKEYERHIDSWSVRGHYRTNKKTGEKIWIKDHVRGEGEMEQRIYGTKPASEVLLIPKMIECEREVKVAVKIKNSYSQDEIIYNGESESEKLVVTPQGQLINIPIESNPSLKRTGIVEYIKSIISKIIRKIKILKN